MANQFESLSDKHRAFIEAQRMFFVASAGPDGRINLSPKGQDSLRITGPNEIVWLNLTGSGNETAAHLLASNRLTLMWCAFEGPPQILRVYGSARTIHPRDEAWRTCAEVLPPPLGARQYFIVDLDLVQTSCGYAVPELEFKQDREILSNWSEKKGSTGIDAYWEETNLISLDGLRTGILED